MKSRHQEKLKVLHQDCMNIIDSTLSDALMQSYIMNRQQLLYKLSVIAFVLEHLIHNYVEQVFLLVCHVVVHVLHYLKLKANTDETVTVRVFSSCCHSFAVSILSMQIL